MADILVVDDDQSMVAAFRRFLADEGHRARFAGDAHDALALAAERRPDLVFMDVRMPGVNGIDTLKELRSRYPDIFVVIMTAYGTSQTSIDAIRSGAFEYLAKPLDLDELRTVIDRALAAQQITREAAVPHAALSAGLVGQTAGMLLVYRIIGRLATNDVPALLLGERGVGKLLVAETIHSNSARADQPFLVVECRSASDEELAEALTTEGGTVFLGNVEALPPAGQARVLRLIGEPQRRQPRPQDRSGPRILASTTAELTEAVEAGAFSRELHEALSVITIRIPPLRDRRDDIPLLVEQLIQRFNAELNRKIRGVDAAVAAAFREHSWPGNVRELESVVKRACILARSNVITMDDLGAGLGAPQPTYDTPAEAALRAAAAAALRQRLSAPGEGPSAPFHDLVSLIERTLVEEALQITAGNQVKASELLGLNRATLRKKMLQ
ncbi:MAG TPA: sigma-54 dependent transcriptional regulator [Vicinamibacterales bacterium]|nr:sigma-54 dependent transcriptional regulator [Vicinamibacterales bacterium]